LYHFRSQIFYRYNKHAAFHSTQLSRLSSSSLENLAFCLANRQLPQDFPPADYSAQLVKAEPPLPPANLDLKLDSCPPGSRIPVTVSALPSQIPTSAQPLATSGSQKRQRVGGQPSAAQTRIDNSEPFVCEFIATEKASMEVYVCIVMASFCGHGRGFVLCLLNTHSHLLCLG
jgi:hypothetical protein